MRNRSEPVTVIAVTFTGGNGAAGVATAIGGAIVSVEITDPGAGYTNAPTPLFTAGGGTGAAGAAVLTAQRLDAIPTVNRPGSPDSPSCRSPNAAWTSGGGPGTARFASPRRLRRSGIARVRHVTPSLVPTAGIDLVGVISRWEG